MSREIIALLIFILKILKNPISSFLDFLESTLKTPKEVLEMSIKDSTREYRLSQWLPIIKECRSSGMKIKDWCEQNNINQKRFYYWQQKLRQAATESLPVPTKQPTFVEIPSLLEPIKDQVLSTFTPSMVLKIDNVSLELSSTIDPNLLATVLKVLKDA